MTTGMWTPSSSGATWPNWPIVRSTACPAASACGFSWPGPWPPRPRIQLWDEPLGPLDVRHALDFLVIARKQADDGRTVILSLHDLRIAHCLDTVAVLDEGRLRAWGHRTKS